MGRDANLADCLSVRTGVGLWKSGKHTTVSHSHWVLGLDGDGVECVYFQYHRTIRLDLTTHVCSSSVLSKEVFHVATFMMSIGIKIDLHS